jgi:protein-L-isoaspartate O-methyltransferase
LDELAKHVIEVGAGTGYSTRLMRHRGINVIGSDPHFGRMVSSLERMILVR